MTVKQVSGDLLKSQVQYICHQVNCQGVMASGIAKSIRETWPEVYDKYKEWHSFSKEISSTDNASEVMMGNILPVKVSNTQTVLNLAAQQNYGYGNSRYTSYDAFWQCLQFIARYVPKGSTIGFPCYIASCRGGANWNIILAMITEVLGKEYEVYIYKLPD